MTIEIAVAGDLRNLLHLRDWLCAQPAVSRNASISLFRPPAEPGSTRSTVDLLTLVTGAALSIADLVGTIADWQESRPEPPPPVTIRRGIAEVTVTGDGRASIGHAIRVLTSG